MNTLNAKLFLRATCHIVQFELVWSRWPFNKLCDTIWRRRVHRRSVSLTADETSRVVDLVFAFLPWKAQCLERSVVATCVLRDYGHPAVLVMGSMQLPSRGHAWVEVDGRVINDRPSVQKKYTVLVRIGCEADQSRPRERQVSGYQSQASAALPTSGTRIPQ